MQINVYKILAVILFLLILWVFYTWDYDKENFGLNLPPKQWMQTDPQKWGQQWYYNNGQLYHPAVPSITNYNDNNYQIPNNSLELLKEQYDKHLKTHDDSTDQLVNSGIPIPRNVNSGQTGQAAGSENINQLGAPLHEILEQEIKLLTPIHKSQQLNFDIEMDLTRHKIQDDNYEINNSDIESVLHELKNEDNTELSQESQLKPIYMPEMEQKIQNKELKIQKDNINEVLMPGMEQKNAIEHKFLKEFNGKNTHSNKDKNLTYALFLLVILIGFIYYDSY